MGRIRTFHVQPFNPECPDVQHVRCLTRLIASLLLLPEDSWASEADSVFREEGMEEEEVVPVIIDAIWRVRALQEIDIDEGGALVGISTAPDWRVKAVAKIAATAELYDDRASRRFRKKDILSQLQDIAN